MRRSRFTEALIIANLKEQAGVAANTAADGTPAAMTTRAAARNTRMVLQSEQFRSKCDYLPAQQ